MVGGGVKKRMEKKWKEKEKMKKDGRSQKEKNKKKRGKKEEWKNIKKPKERKERSEVFSLPNIAVGGLIGTIYMCVCI